MSSEDFEDALLRQLKSAHIEADRFQSLNQTGTSSLQPPSYDSLNEVLDRTSIIQSNFTDFVLKHPAILTNPKLYKLAYITDYLLCRLYREIGQVIGDLEKNKKLTADDMATIKRAQSLIQKIVELDEESRKGMT